MELTFVRSSIVEPAMLILPTGMNTPKARVMLGAIGLQESKFMHTAQVGGPAQGYWQFEQGGVKGVLTHPASVHYAQAVCARFDVEPNVLAVYHALAANEVLACVFARLLLFTDKRPLPEIEDVTGSWAYYVANWRPGKPHVDTWNGNHAQAVSVMV